MWRPVRISGIDHKPYHRAYHIYSCIGSVFKFFKMSFSKKIIIPLAFTLSLLIIRIILSNELTYIFLAWNLFLAWIPFALSQRLHGVKNRWKLFFLVGGWLLFLPNAPYIITDFLHLKQRFPIPYWYDILLLFSAALNGLLLGLLSLFTVEKFLDSPLWKQISGYHHTMLFFSLLIWNLYGSVPALEQLGYYR
jgi:uncharacterized membrane protein